MTQAELHILGAAGTVTGSKYLLKVAGRRIMIDCGLFQGVKKLRELNWQQLPVHAGEVDLVLLTHGHLDHTGFLPRLLQMGFAGSVWATAPTLDITGVILRDSAKIQEEDAERANAEGFTRHDPALPLYDLNDVERTLTRLEAKPLNQWMPVGEGIQVRFRYNGHILGAVFIELEVQGKRFVFSGDIGRVNDPLLRRPEIPERADVLLLESTYGDRLHPVEEPEEKLGAIVKQTVKRQGTLIIPSFAVERAQLLLYLLWKLRSSGRIPGVPIILDSPMGAEVFSLFQKYPEWHKLSTDDCNAMMKAVRVITSFKETWNIIDDAQPKIVVAGSGMVTGGRVLTYLQQYIGRPETTVLLAGYQAAGTRGRQLLEVCEEIKFYGKYHRVRAGIESLQSLSAHADQEDLLQWVAGMDTVPGQTLLVHGEPQAADALRVKLRDVCGADAEIPELYEIREIPI